MLLLIGFLLVLFLEAARRQRNQALILEYQYRFFALRDSLREMGMQDPEVARDWLFQYLDSTIAKSIRLLPRISIWYVLGLYLTHKDDAAFEEVRKRLEDEYSKPGNEKYKEIEEQFLNTLGSFIVSRHILMLIVSALALVFPVTIVRAMQQAKQRSLELLVESPETSTLYKFVPVTG